MSSEPLLTRLGLFHGCCLPQLGDQRGCALTQKKSKFLFRVFAYTCRKNKQPERECVNSNDLVAWKSAPVQLPLTSQLTHLYIYKITHFSRARLVITMPPKTGGGRKVIAASRAKADGAGKESAAAKGSPSTRGRKSAGGARAGKRPAGASRKSDVQRMCIYDPSSSSWYL